MDKKIYTLTSQQVIVDQEIIDKKLWDKKRCSYDAFPYYLSAKLSFNKLVVDDIVGNQKTITIDRITCIDAYGYCIKNDRRKSHFDFIVVLQVKNQNLKLTFNTEEKMIQCLQFCYYCNKRKEKEKSEYINQLINQINCLQTDEIVMATNNLISIMPKESILDINYFIGLKYSLDFNEQSPIKPQNDNKEHKYLKKAKKLLENFNDI